MYNTFSVDYDYFVNWPARLAAEMPFLEAQLQSLGSPGQPARVLDAACGTGMHVIELARRGYAADGADLSSGMIERARANAAAAGVKAGFEALGFGHLAGQFQNYHAVLCLGNSLPHVLAADELARTLADFAACLHPGGRLVIQNRNFDLVLARHERWMGPEFHRDGEKEWLFVRFYDFDPDGRLTFNILTLTREDHSGSQTGEQTGWQQRAISTRLYPQRKDELVAALETAGFEAISVYGGLNGTPFAPESSPNLVVVAQKGR